MHISPHYSAWIYIYVCLLLILVSFLFIRCALCIARIFTFWMNLNLTALPLLHSHYAAPQRAAVGKYISNELSKSGFHGISKCCFSKGNSMMLINMILPHFWIFLGFFHFTKKDGSENSVHIKLKMNLTWIFGELEIRDESRLLLHELEFGLKFNHLSKLKPMFFFSMNNNIYTTITLCNFWCTLCAFAADVYTFSVLQVNTFLTSTSSSVSLQLDIHRIEPGNWFRVEGKWVRRNTLIMC